MTRNILIDEISVSNPTKVGIFITKRLEDAERHEPAENFVILQVDEMNVSKVEEKELLLPNNRYLLLQRKIWSSIKKFLSASKAERYTSGSIYNMEEILLNSTLQKIAKQKKDEGDSYMHDLYSRFLEIASHRSFSLFSRKQREITAQFELCRIALQILIYFLSIAPAADQSKVSQNVIIIRSSPPKPSVSGGICMIGFWLIILGEGLLVGLNYVFTYLF
ncbi:MAG: hypothetical protein ACW964_06395 [Candidatus Hodarchaeales archaeon]|jgi:hypothetical protein